VISEIDNEIINQINNIFKVTIKFSISQAEKKENFSFCQTLWLNYKIKNI
jgi:hypothetical protein